MQPRAAHRSNQLETLGGSPSCGGERSSLVYGKKESRKRTRWSAEEEAELRRGFNRYGNQWAEILKSFSFHSSRSSVDLKDKYRNLCKNK